MSAAAGTSMTRPGPNGITYLRSLLRTCLQGLRGTDVDTQRFPARTFQPPQISKPVQIRGMVEHYLETRRQKFWVVNTTTEVVHLPGVSETSTGTPSAGGRVRGLPRTRVTQRPEFANDALDSERRKISRRTNSSLSQIWRTRSCRLD